MRLSRHTSSYGRQAVQRSPALHRAIAAAEPAEAEVQLFGSSSWKAYITLDGVMLGESTPDEASPAAAFDVALRVMRTRDGGAA